MRRLRHDAARDDRRRSLVDEFDDTSLGDGDDEWKKVNRRIKRDGERLEKALADAKTQLDLKEAQLRRKPRLFDEDAKVRDSVSGRRWLIEYKERCGREAAVVADLEKQLATHKKEKRLARFRLRRPVLPPAMAAALAVKTAPREAQMAKSSNSSGVSR